MKALAIILMIITIIMMGVFGLFYLMGFAMSFDAPGSDKDPQAWGMRLLIFLPEIIFLVMLILAWMAYSSGQYKKSAILGAVSPGVMILFFIWMSIASMSSMVEYNNELAKEKELEAKYPVQKYIRQTGLGTDTIIVWPNGIVAYRLHLAGMENTWNGPLGDLSEDRTTITYDRRPDTRLPMEDLVQFVDESGRKFTEVFVVQ